MSVEVMAMVFKRYPVGGGEYVLALALADHAHDDGSHVFPSVKSLALKTRQSERTVQRQLQKMVGGGWLVVVSKGGAGARNTAEYRICLAWMEGADFDALPKVKGDKMSPLTMGESEPIKGDIQSNKGDIAVSRKGDIAVSPESSITITKPSEAAQQTAQPIADTPAKQVCKIGWDVPDKMFKGITTERMEAWERAFPSFDVEGELARIDLWYERRTRESPRFRWKNAERGIHNWLSRAYADSRKPKVFVKSKPVAAPPM